MSDVSDSSGAPNLFSFAKRLDLMVEIRQWAVGGPFYCSFTSTSPEYRSYSVNRNGMESFALFGEGKTPDVAVEDLVEKLRGRTITLYSERKEKEGIFGWRTLRLSEKEFAVPADL